MADNILKLGIPAGSLQEATAELFRKAGYRITFSSRSYYPTIDDDEIRMPVDPCPRDGSVCRARHFGRRNHRARLGAETQADVVEVCELIFSKVSRRPVRWVLCVPEDSPVQWSRICRASGSQPRPSV
ncbi:MAG: hypothetical protein R3C99_26560 [Pirellulaceae bacterium]